MGFRFVFLSGFGAGYYLGARAGRHRYEQINRTLSRARRSPVVETAAEKARSLVGRDGDGSAPSRDPAAGADTHPVVAPSVSPDVRVADVAATDVRVADVAPTDVVVTDADGVADVVTVDPGVDGVTVDPGDYSSSR